MPCRAIKAFFSREDSIGFEGRLSDFANIGAVKFLAAPVLEVTFVNLFWKLPAKPVLEVTFVKSREPFPGTPFLVAQSREPFPGTPFLSSEPFNCDFSVLIGLWSP